MRKSARLRSSHSLVQPGSSEHPEPIARPTANTQGFGGLLMGQSREKAQLHQRGDLRIVPLQLTQCFVEHQQLVGPRFVGDVKMIEVKTLQRAAVFLALFFPRALDQDSPHAFGGGGNEVASTLPVLRPIDIDESNISLVYQRGRVERLPGLLIRHPPRRQSTQFVVHQRQKLLGLLRIPGLDALKDARNAAHSPRKYIREPRRRSSI